MILHFSLQLFYLQNINYWSRWENLDPGKYPFQQIKLGNLVDPSPYETEPYNNISLTELSGLYERILSLQLVVCTDLTVHSIFFHDLGLDPPIQTKHD